MNASPTVVVVDYGVGNLRSVANALSTVATSGQFQVLISANPADIDHADRLVLPGQGAMKDCMDSLESSGLKSSILKAVQTKPLFGVCVGMQMLLDYSEEGAALGQKTPALGLIPGSVKRFQLQGRLQPDGSRFKVPQMGWNQVDYGSTAAAHHMMWHGIPNQSYFYFVHSFYANPSNPVHTAAVADYGGLFTAVLQQNNIFATQFHPEKSGEQGLALYRNFLSWQP
jgi:glutamine amidotransferase